jgi:hypothetical protein
MQRILLSNKNDLDESPENYAKQRVTKSQLHKNSILPHSIYLPSLKEQYCKIENRLVVARGRDKGGEGVEWG